MKIRKCSREVFYFRETKLEYPHKAMGSLVVIDPISGHIIFLQADMKFAQVA